MIGNGQKSSNILGSTELNKEHQKSTECKFLWKFKCFCVFYDNTDFKMNFIIKFFIWDFNQLFYYFDQEDSIFLGYPNLALN